VRYFYVISPVASDAAFDEKRSILEEVGKQYDLRPFFPLERNSHLTAPDLVSDIREAAFVIADLSLERPSCYFELGVAEAMKTRVFLLAATDTRIHQVGDQPVTFYANSEQYRHSVREIMNAYLPTSFNAGVI
jgi:hypothetical protein